MTANHSSAATKICKLCGRSYPKSASPLRGHTGRVCPGCLPAWSAARRARAAAYTAWYNMQLRCHDSTTRDFQRYGGRGITVCARWCASFDNFLADVGPRPAVGYSIDRIDVNGNYEPGNVRWADAKTQARNKRNNRLICFNGRTQTMAAWAEELGMPLWTLSQRLNTLGHDVERALTQPLLRRRSR